MNKQESIKKITKKREFSNLPKKDVEKAFRIFEKRQTSEEDKIKLTRDLLRKVYFAFGSLKLLNLKDKEEEWFLKKHLSTRERLDYYSELYSKLVYPGENIFDLGAGINGFSYKFFPKGINYVAVEAVGQLVDLMNYYFQKKNFKGSAIHESLFEIDNLKKILNKGKGKKVVFLFKVVDSLEMMEKNYSKEFLNEIVPLVDRVIVSFATRSLIKKTRFKVKRYWFENFIKDNFNLLNDFELGNERYLVFSK